VRLPCAGWLVPLLPIASVRARVLLMVNLTVTIYPQLYKDGIYV
jgi:hypothetical protein